MAGKKREIEQLLPLTPRVLLILWGLAEGPQHGYRLLKTTEELGRGRVSIGPASLYEAIHSLKAKGLVDESAAPEGERTDSRRRYFALTDLGRRVLEAEAERVLELAEDLRRAEVLSAGRRV
jgi:DNA-binding PadR family transcriptional regulator